MGPLGTRCFPERVVFGVWGFHCLGLEGLGLVVTVPSLQYVRGSHNFTNIVIYNIED